MSFMFGVIMRKYSRHLNKTWIHSSIMSIRF